MSTTLTQYGMALLYKRVISDPDIDFVGAQTNPNAPAGTTSPASYQIPGMGGALPTGQPVVCEAWCVFTDDNGVIKHGEGDFQFRALKIKTAPADGGALGGGVVIGGSVVSAQAAYQPIEIPNVRTGDMVSVQLSSINAGGVPVGATQIWIYLDAAPLNNPV